MLKIYGIPQARAFRPLWMLHEPGLPCWFAQFGFRANALSGADCLAYTQAQTA